MRAARMKSCCSLCAPTLLPSYPLSLRRVSSLSNALNLSPRRLGKAIRTKQQGGDEKNQDKV